MKKFNIFLIVIALAVQMSCSYEEPDAVIQEFDGTAEELIRLELPNISLFAEAAERVGLDSRLTGSEAFTFFAPTNAALQAALEANGFNTLADADDAFLIDLIDNHTIAGKVESGDLSKTSVTTVGNDLVYISVANGVVLNATSTVVDADNEADNGIIHIIDFPLLSSPEGSIADIVVASASATEPEFTTLLAALEATGLDDALAAEGSEFTVFAPTDATFALFGLNADNIVGAFGVDGLTEVLSYHVLNERNFTIDLESGRIFSILGGPNDNVRGFDIAVSNSSIEIEVQNTFVASATSRNILATNGTIHVINDLMLPDDYVYDAINGTANLSGAGFDGVLLGAYFNGLSNATNDYEALLSTEEAYTLLVPRFFDDSRTGEELNNVIEDHIFEGIVDISDAVGTKITSINDREYYVTENTAGRIFVNGRSGIQTFTSGAPIIQDFGVYNGLISNFVSEFTPLPAENVSEIITADAVATDSLNLFNEALVFLELDDLTDVTYLYPTDAAFADAYIAAGIAADPAELSDPDLDREVLEEAVNAHIVPVIFFSNGIEVGTTVTNRNGDTLEVAEVTANGETEVGLLVAGSSSFAVIPLGETDVLAANGVIHVINGALE